MDVVAKSGASLQCQRCGQHFEDGVHGPPFPQSLVQRLDVDTAGYEVGQQQEEVKTLETWEREKRQETSATLLISDSGGSSCGIFLTCLLSAEVLQRISRRVGVQQQDSETEIGVRRNRRALLEGRTGSERRLGTNDWLHNISFQHQ